VVTVVPMGALVIFSVNVRRAAAFYEAVLGALSVVELSGDIRLVNDQDEVLIHSLPETIAATIQISTPPAARDGTPIKPVFDVESLDVALEGVSNKGGVVTGRSFSDGGLERHDVLDPDGNVIQLRAPTR
jgi:predicted enzyme related to lactoylglutathione lyase